MAQRETKVPSGTDGRLSRTNKKEGDANITSPSVTDSPVENEPPKYAPSKYDTFLRSFSGISLLVNLQSTPIAFLNTIGSGLLVGGPRVLFWGPLIGWAFASAISASIAEMSSLEPYVGGQYIWIYTNSPTWMHKRGRLMLGHVQAYITFIGWILAAGLLPTLMSGYIMLLVEIYHPGVANWTLKTVGGVEVGIGIFILALCFVLTLNKYMRVCLGQLEVCGMLLLCVICVILYIALPVTGSRNSARFAFLGGTLEQVASSWGNRGFGFCQGISLVFFMYTASDGIVHMAAEITNPTHRVPNIIFLSTQIGALLSLLLAFLVPLYMGPLTEEVLSSAYPIITILQTNTGSRALPTVIAILIVLQIFPCAVGSVATAARLTLQLSQQGAMPKWWIRLFHLKGTVGPLIFVCGFGTIFLLMNVGSSTAIVTLFGLATGFLVSSYGILIFNRILYRLSSSGLDFGPWNMGKYGLLVNLVAAPSCLFIVVCNCMPLFEPVTAATFPYLGPSLLIVAILALVDHVVRGEAFNPVRNIRVAKSVVEAQESFVVAEV